MARTYEISFKLGAQMAGNFAKTMSSASGALNELNSKIAQLNKSQSSIDKLVGLRNQVAQSSREYRRARDNVSALAREISNTENPTKEMTRNFEKAKREVSNVKTRLENQREQLRALNKTMGTSKTRTADLAKQQEQFAKATERAQKAQSSLQGTLAKQQANIAQRGELRGQLFDAAGLAVALGAPLKIAANFEQAMDKVGAVASATDSQLARMTKTARTLGATTEWSATQAAEGMQFLSMAGFNAEQTIAAMPGMLSLASAGAIDLATAADIASNVLTGFNLQADQSARLSDVMANTFTTSNTNLAMLGETMSYVAPVAASTNVSLEQTAAMAGKLGDAGIQASKAGTSLRTIISRLAAPAGKAATTLQNLGVSTRDASGNLRDLPTVLADIEGAMGGMGTAARAEITSTIFGLEAASAATVLLGQAGSGNLQKYAETLTKTGTAANVAKKQNDNAAGSMKRLASAGESIAITAGNVLLPTLASMADKIAGVVSVADTLAQNFPFLTSLIVGATAALIAMRIATIAGAYAFTFIKGAWLAGAAVLKTLRIAYLLHTGALLASTNATKAAVVVSKLMTAAQWLFNAALTANPIGLVIAAIAALVAAGIALYRNWDKVTAFFSAAWQKIKDLFMRFHPLGWVIKGFSKMWDYLSNISLYDSGKKMLMTFVRGITSMAFAPIRAVRNILSKVRDYLPFSDAKVGPLSELTASGQAIMTTLGDGIKKAQVSSVSNPFSDAASQLSDMKTGVQGVADNRSFGGITLNVRQQISVDGNGNTREQAREGARQGAADLMRDLRDAMNRERRLSYG